MIIIHTYSLAGSPYTVGFMGKSFSSFKKAVAYAYKKVGKIFSTSVEIHSPLDFKGPAAVLSRVSDKFGREQIDEGYAQEVVDGEMI